MEPRHSFFFDDLDTAFIGHVGNYDAYTYHMQDNKGWLMLQGPTSAGSRQIVRPRELELVREGASWRCINVYTHQFGNHPGIPEDEQALKLFHETLASTATGDALERL